MKIGNILHREALTEAGKKLFPFLGHFGNFYLAGGTALALQLGHRVSADFDLFSEKPIRKTLLKNVETVFGSRKITVLVNNADELTMLVDGVKITFLHYPFPLLTHLETIDSMRMLCVKELAVTKAYTIGRRGSFKDYIDMYAVLKEKHASLDELIALAEKKYADAFNARLFLEQLVYLDDITDTEIVFLKDSVAKKDLERFFADVISHTQILNS